MTDAPNSVASALPEHLGDGDDRLARSLSALADGAAAPAEVDQILKDWGSDPALRARWHRYHWMGDVMRSADLAQAPQRDLDVATALRAALAREPERLMPPPAKPVRPAWGQAMAAAAGLGAVALVAWVLAVDDAAQAPGAGATMAQGAPALSLAPGVAVATLPAPMPSLVGGPATRDEQLDRYLAAHRGAVLPVGWSAATLARPDVTPR